MAVKKCIHLVGIDKYDYEGWELIYEGEHRSSFADGHIDFKFCPNCGKEIGKEE